MEACREETARGGWSMSDLMPADRQADSTLWGRSLVAFLFPFLSLSISSSPHRRGDRSTTVTRVELCHGTKRQSARPSAPIRGLFSGPTGAGIRRAVALLRTRDKSNTPFSLTASLPVFVRRQGNPGTTLQRSTDTQTNTAT